MKKAKKAAGMRRLFVVDVENFVGKSRLEVADIEKAKSMFCKKMNPSDRDLVIVGTSHKCNWQSAMVAWRGPRHVLKHGHDGADLALIEALKTQPLAGFGEVVFLSGDGIFTDEVERLLDVVEKVTVVSIKKQLSNKLFSAVCCSA